MAIMFDKMCRTCLAVDTAMLSIFGSDKSGANSQAPSSIAGMLSSFSSVTITETDGLPKQACLSCISEINRAYFFKIKCENSQNTLKEYLQATNPTTNETNEADKDVSVCQDVKMECDDGVLLFEAPVNAAGNQDQLVSQENEVESEVNQNDSRGYVVQKIVKCVNCTELFENVQKYNAHFKNCCKGKRLSLKCPLCPISFLERASCLKHFLMSHPTELPAALVETVLSNESENRNENSEEAEKEDENDVSREDQPEIPLPQPLPWLYESMNESQTEKLPENDSNSDTDQSLNSENGDEKNTNGYAFSCTACSSTFETSNEFIFHLPSCRKRRKSTRNATTLEDDKHNVMKTEDSFEDSRSNKESRGTRSMTRRSTMNKNSNNQQRRSLSLFRKRSNRQKSSLECRFCKKLYVSKKRLESHLIMHQNETDPTTASDQRHKLTESVKERAETEGVGKNQCILCLAVFLSRQVLKAHLRTHSGEKLACALCYKTFKEMKSLKTHMKRHARSKPYKCDKCEKSFISRSELNSHSRMHLENSCVCDVCGAAFRGTFQLSQHKLIHSEKRPHACDMCKLRFTSVAHLKSHKLTHTNEKPFHCEICNRRFSRKGDCKKHTLTHQT